MLLYPGIISLHFISFQFEIPLHQRSEAAAVSTLLVYAAFESILNSIAMVWTLHVALQLQLMERNSISFRNISHAILHIS